MKKSNEIAQKINAKRLELENYKRTEKYTEAQSVATELNKLVDEYNVQAALEKSDFENLVNKFEAEMKNGKKKPPDDEKKLCNRAFNKLIFGREKYLTDDERQAYLNVTGSPGQPGQIESIDGKGGYLVPEEQMKTLLEFRKAYVALKDYVTVVHTNTTSGRYPILPFQQLQFQAFDEMTDISESDINFDEATYTISDRGLIVPVSKQLVADADIDVMSLVGRMLAEGAVVAENKAILAELNNMIATTENNVTTLKVTPITSYKAFNKALLRDLDGIYYNQAKIFTNQDGITYLSNIVDAMNRPLFTPDVTAPDTYRYRGKEIVVIPNLTLPSIEDSQKRYAPFFVGDMKAYLTFFERQGMELATSEELYFRKYGLALRAVVRWGVKVTDANAMLALAVEF